MREKCFESKYGDRPLAISTDPAVSKHPQDLGNVKGFSRQIHRINSSKIMIEIISHVVHANNIL